MPRTAPHTRDRVLAALGAERQRLRARLGERASPSWRRSSKAGLASGTDEVVMSTLPLPGALARWFEVRHEYG